MKPRFLLLLFGLSALLLLGYAATGLYEVRPGESAVVRRFGRVLAERPEPGLHLGMPWGVDRVDRVAVDHLRRVVVGYQDGGDAEMPGGQLLTGDHNLVNVQAAIYYKIRPDQVADYVVQADRVDGLTARAAETVMAEWVASRTVDEALLNGKVGLRAALGRASSGTHQRLCSGRGDTGRAGGVNRAARRSETRLRRRGPRTNAHRHEIEHCRTGSGNRVARRVIGSVPH